MAKACPNINSQDWKDLVAEHGEEKAVRMFIENGYDIPVSILAELNPEVFNDGYVFNGRSVTQTLNKNPKLAMEIVQRLQQQFPEVIINEGGLFDENGNWVDIKPGEKGMHARGAFVSAVAYGNEATVETIPHEYAHEYIQMFRNHPKVREALRTKSEEQLATQLGNFYAKRATQDWFNKLLNDVMYLVKRVFKSPVVSEVIARDFYRGKHLGPEAGREGYVSYQKSQGADGAKRVSGAFNPPLSIARGDVSQFLMTDSDVKTQYTTKILGNYRKSDGSFDYDGFHDFAVQQIINAMDAQLELNRASSVDVTQYNHVQLDANGLKDLREFLTDSAGGARQGNVAILYLFLTGELDFNRQSPANQQMLQTYLRIHQNIGFPNLGIRGYQTIVADNIFAEENKVVAKEEIVDRVREEFQAKLNNRDTFFQKVQGKIPKQLAFLKNLDLSKISPWLYDGYLLAKSLTMQTNSLFRKLFYDSLNRATEVFEETQLGFRKRIEPSIKINKFDNWGTGDFKGSITDYQTYDVKVIDGTIVPLTRSEAVNLYLMLSQRDTHDAIVDKGIILDEHIDGRNIPYNQPIKLSKDSIALLMQRFLMDEENSAVINSVRDVMGYLHDRVQPTFRQLNGYNLPRLENYFPAYYGKVSLEQRKQKNILEDFRSGHARLGGNMPVRIGDYKRIVNNAAITSGMYGAFTIPIRNNRIVLNNLRSEYKGSSIEIRLDQVEGYLNKIEDPTMLYSSQGEKQMTQKINEVMSNFGIFALGYNPFTVIKQTASYMNARQYVPSKYLKQAGHGLGPVILPKLKTFFTALKKADGSADMDVVRKLIPLEFQLNNSNATYAEIERYSPRLTYRLEGHVSREMSEALMNVSQGKDVVKIHVPGTKKTFEIHKHRAMEAIRVMEGVNTMTLWNAVKFMTNDEISRGVLNLQKDSVEYWEHIAVKTEEVIARTQANSEIINRSIMSTEKNLLARGFTMFSSDSQKLGMIMIDKIMDFNNNPTAANGKRVVSTMASVMFMNAVYITAIDMMRAALMGYGDDDDSQVSFALHSVTNNMAGYFHLFGNIVRMISSRLDDQPWVASAQHPIEILMDDFADASANMLKGKFGQASQNALDIILKVKGVPGFPLKAPVTIYENYSE